MITIMTASYNDNDVVGKAIQSCLNQNFDEDYEIVVVDDGSDIPLRVPDDDRIRLIRHRRNKGLSEALNTAVRNSRGTHLCICSADDELHPNYLSALYPHTENADIVSCDFIANGRHVRCGPGSVETLMNKNIHSYAALYSKEIFVKNGGYKWYMNPSWEDWEFWLNAAKNGAKWHHVSYPYHKYNRNPTGRDADSQDKGNLLRGKMCGAHQDLFGKGAGVVTVVIPCFKHEKWVNNAIKSCYDQLYPHIDVIVVNDGSMKPKKFTSLIEDDRVTVIHQRNKGLSAARNVGIRKALDNGSEYITMLDADDEMDPLFIEDCMATMTAERKEYVYTDVQFIGDANHKYECDDYDCFILASKHIHACTFLARSSMYRNLIDKRGYAYDESMKKGYEDWEFALAVLNTGWCGRKLAKYYFKYRFHTNGSMRTDASKINKELVKTVRSKQPWVANREVIVRMCKTCGGGSGRYTNQIMKGANNIAMIISIPGIGEVNGDSPIRIKYTGATSSTMTKVGPSGKVYKYTNRPASDNPTFPNEFTAFAKDYHLFAGPQFAVSLIQVTKVVPELMKAERTVPVSAVPVSAVPVSAVPKLKVQDPNRITKTAAQLVIEKTLAKDTKMKEKLPGTASEELPPHDDFTSIDGIGPGRNKTLYDNDIHYYEDMIGMNAKTLSGMLKVGVNEAGAMIKMAEDELEKLM